MTLPLKPIHLNQNISPEIRIYLKPFDVYNDQTQQTEPSQGDDFLSYDEARQVFGSVELFQEKLKSRFNVFADFEKGQIVLLLNHTSSVICEEVEENTSVPSSDNGSSQIRLASGGLAGVAAATLLLIEAAWQEITSSRQANPLNLLQTNALNRLTESILNENLNVEERIDAVKGFVELIRRAQGTTKNSFLEIKLLNINHDLEVRSRTAGVQNAPVRWAIGSLTWSLNPNMEVAKRSQLFLLDARKPEEVKAVLDFFDSPEVVQRVLGVTLSRAQIREARSLIEWLGQENSHGLRRMIPLSAIQDLYTLRGLGFGKPYLMQVVVEARDIALKLNQINQINWSSSDTSKYRDRLEINTLHQLREELKSRGWKQFTAEMALPGGVFNKEGVNTVNDFFFPREGFTEAQVLEIYQGYDHSGALLEVVATLRQLAEVQDWTPAQKMKVVMAIHEYSYWPEQRVMVVQPLWDDLKQNLKSPENKARYLVMIQELDFLKERMASNPFTEAARLACARAVFEARIPIYEYLDELGEWRMTGAVYTPQEKSLEAILDGVNELEAFKQLFANAKALQPTLEATYSGAARSDGEMSVKGDIEEGVTKYFGANIFEKLEIDSTRIDAVKNLFAGAQGHQLAIEETYSRSTRSDGVEMSSKDAVVEDLRKIFGPAIFEKLEIDPDPISGFEELSEKIEIQTAKLTGFSISTLRIFIRQYEELHATVISPQSRVSYYVTLTELLNFSQLPNDDKIRKVFEAVDRVLESSYKQYASDALEQRRRIERERDFIWRLLKK